MCASLSRGDGPLNTGGQEGRRTPDHVRRHIEQELALQKKAESKGSSKKERVERLKTNFTEYHREIDRYMGRIELLPPWVREQFVDATQAYKRLQADFKDVFDNPSKLVEMATSSRFGLSSDGNEARLRDATNQIYQLRQNLEANVPVAELKVTEYQRDQAQEELRQTKRDNAALQRELDETWRDKEHLRSELGWVQGSLQAEIDQRRDENKTLTARLDQANRKNRDLEDQLRQAEEIDNEFLRTQFREGVRKNEDLARDNERLGEQAREAMQQRDKHTELINFDNKYQERVSKADTRCAQGIEQKIHEYLKHKREEMQAINDRYDQLISAVKFHTNLPSEGQPSSEPSSRFEPETTALLNTGWYQTPASFNRTIAENFEQLDHAIWQKSQKSFVKMKEDLTDRKQILKQCEGEYDDNRKKLLDYINSIRGSSRTLKSELDQELETRDNDDSEIEQEKSRLLTSGKASGETTLIDERASMNKRYIVLFNEEFARKIYQPSDEMKWEDLNKLLNDLEVSRKRRRQAARDLDHTQSSIQEVEQMPIYGELFSSLLKEAQRRGIQSEQLKLDIIHGLGKEKAEEMLRMQDEIIPYLDKITNELHKIRDERITSLKNWLERKKQGVEKKYANLDRVAPPDERPKSSTGNDLE